MRADRGRCVLDYLELRGLTPAPSQVWGTVRLVPLIRDHVRGDLRLGLRSYGEALTRVALRGLPEEPAVQYTSFIPHGLIVAWQNDEQPLASWKTTLGRQKRAKDGRVAKRGWCQTRTLHRVVKKLDRRVVRMLPMHVAMEGFLAMHFGGPDVAYDYYSMRALRTGLSPRSESALPGSEIFDLGEALRLFEMHENQCGVLIYVGDALASAFVVPHPVDYAYMHASLVLDMYAEVFWYYGMMWNNVSPFAFEIDAGQIDSLEELTRAFESSRAEFADFEVSMGSDLVGRELWSERVYRMGSFTLERFITDLNADEDTNHIGEAIVRQDGTLEYLKTFRLSRAMVQRGHLLDLLAKHEWDMLRAAKSSGITASELRNRFVRADLGYIFRHGERTRFR